MKTTNLPHRPVSSILIAALLFGISTYGTAAADSLDEVLNSVTAQDFSKQNTSRLIDTSNYSASFPKKSGYSQLFVERDGIILLSKWIGADTKSSPLKTISSWRNKEYIVVKFSVRIGKSSGTAKILVPDPNSHSLVQFKALREFTELAPPNLKATGQSEVRGKNFSGLLYEGSDGSCSILFKLPHHSRFQLKSSCEDKAHLIKLALHLPISKLVKKLE